jgi:toxin ParE1/3/4
MSQFSLTEKAKDDLKKIARFTQNRWGKGQRNIYLKSLDGCFHQLSENPAMGRSCDEIKPGYYKFPTGCHVVYYRCKTEKMIEIVRVLHESMDVELQLSGERNTPN